MDAHTDYIALRRAYEATISGRESPSVGVTSGELLNSWRGVACYDPLCMYLITLAGIVLVQKIDRG